MIYHHDFGVLVCKFDRYQRVYHRLRRHARTAVKTDEIHTALAISIKRNRRALGVKLLGAFEKIAHFLSLF